VIIYQIFRDIIGEKLLINATVKLPILISTTAIIYNALNLKVKNLKCIHNVFVLIQLYININISKLISITNHEHRTRFK